MELTQEQRDVLLADAVKAAVRAFRGGVSITACFEIAAKTVLFNLPTQHPAVRQEEETMFICASWKRIREGSMDARRTLVYRCDYPDGHEGLHVDKVLGVTWPQSDSDPESYPINEWNNLSQSPAVRPVAEPGGDEDIYANSFHVWNDPKGATSWAELGEHLQGRWRTAIGTVLAVARERVLAEAVRLDEMQPIMSSAVGRAIVEQVLGEVGNRLQGCGFSSESATKFATAVLARLSQPVVVEPVDRVTIVQKRHGWEVYCDGQYEMGGLSEKNANRLAGSIRAELDAMKKEAL